MTPKTRKDLQKQIISRDRQDSSRWRDDYAQPRIQVAIFDLVDAQNRVSREIMELLKSDELDRATRMAKSPSPIETVNNILAGSTLSIRLSIDDEGDVQTGHDGGAAFSITQLSDGERNAVMLAAQVLTAEPDTLFIIDEPERHLHRAITEPMLTALFEKRKDCSFVISTHEPELPNSKNDAIVVIVRSCSWNGAIASGRDVDILPPDLEVPDETRKAILGSRRSIMFVEGETQSLDYPLVSTLFPGLSVIPKGSCMEVERSVVGLAGTAELHWLKPIGLVDRDDRTDDEVGKLAARDVFALEVSAIESIFYSSRAIEAMASIQAKVFGLDKDQLVTDAKSAAFAVLDDDTKESLAARRSEKSARNKLLNNLPKWQEIKANKGANIHVEVATAFVDELTIIKDSLRGQQLDKITSRFSIKKTRIPSVIAEALQFSTRRHYEDAIVTHAKNNEEFRNNLRSYLGPVVEKLMLPP